MLFNPKDQNVIQQHVILDFADRLGKNMQGKIVEKIKIMDENLPLGQDDFVNMRRFYRGRIGLRYGTIDMNRKKNGFLARISDKDQQCVIENKLNFLINNKPQNRLKTDCGKS